eukprot:TRINITY_DN79579_c0_g1_i1.p1 TRINITY_DN79579_c0_g1~~TRINITY_DN79579_c0_g1_i1.p1  ORF type:complete len:522 (-),score=98.08 TRINITY_DN79579_c0_g1_i1:66-1631(-)
MAKLSKALLPASFVVIALVLSGCGDDSPSPSPSPSPSGPVECTKELKRGHCTTCGNDKSGAVQCLECAQPYSLDSAKLCSVDCSSLPKPADPPAMPNNPQEHNGKEWPHVCFDNDEEHFFVIGDWGGVCSWGPGNNCNDPGGNIYGHPGQPFPMYNNNRGGNKVANVDKVAQNLVADRMKERALELRKQGKAPKFVINVGDNFYPGGLDSHCGTKNASEAFEASQFAQIFEQIYPVQDLGNIEWWSVLGNHDYGGVCYIKGWDQQIYYTWKPDGRWVMPAQFWSRKVQFKTFSADFWFLDTNILDVYNPSTDAGHNLCSKFSNPGTHCEANKYPPHDGLNASSCGPGGPGDCWDCGQWFRDLWARQYTWIEKALSNSVADWQIVVMHHPPSYSPGYGKVLLNWKSFAAKFGIDLMISGHQHLQKVYYKKKDGAIDLEETAWVITGGGGGITSEILPADSGYDDAYGFMDMKISLETIEITAISHGGVHGKYIVRNHTVVYPRQRGSERDVAEQAEQAVTYI